MGWPGLTKAIAPNDLERVIVDSTVQEKAIAFPIDCRLLKRQRRIQGRVIRDLERRLPTLPEGMKEIAT